MDPFEEGWDVWSFAEPVPGYDPVNPSPEIIDDHPIFRRNNGDFLGIYGKDNGMGVKHLIVF